MEKSKGLLITFEGIEGCGKSTQARSLYEWLKSQGYDCIFTKEPGGTSITQKIRDILLDKKNRDLSEWAEFFLYLADRAQDVSEVIKPALLAGKIVIADRFSDATMAYQGAGRGISVKLIKDMNAIATQGIIPDFTILIDVSPEQGFKRIECRDRMELESKEFHSRVRGEYLKIAREKSNRVKVLDGTLKVEELVEQIRSLVKPLLK